MNDANEIYYTRCVIELAETIPVTTSQAIFSVTGIKLVNPGVRLNSTFFERFARQSLLPPLEQCLVVDQGVDHAALEQIAQDLLREDAAMQQLAASLPDEEALLQPLRRAILCEPAIFLLTLAREQRPQLLRHSVQVALLCAYLGIRTAMSAQQLALVTTAGLLHDLGELRIADLLFDTHYRPSLEERKLLRTHPAIAQHMLLNSAAYPLELIQAVVQHHERMDGSGYPFAIRGSEMTRYGRILSLAEAVTSKLDERHSAAGLEFMLKLNAHQFDANLLAIMLDVYGRYMRRQARRSVSATAADVPRLHQEIGKLELALVYWQRLLADAQPLHGPAAFIQQRLARLALVTRAAGVNPADKASLTAGIEHDAAGLDEVEQLSYEALQQVREIVIEVHRRWPHYAADRTPTGEVVRGWMEHMEELLLDAEVHA